MAVTKAKKAGQIEKLNQDLQKASSMIVGTFSKLTVAKDFELRKTVRSAGGKYQVVKNTLAQRAGEGTQVAEALKGLKGVTSIAYTSGDPVALAKALSKYVSDNPEYSFKSGVLEGRVISMNEIKALATMPSKEEIYSKLLFLISAPAQRLVTVMNAVGRDLAIVVSQGVEKKKFKDDAVVTAEAVPTAVKDDAVVTAEAAPTAVKDDAGVTAEAFPTAVNGQVTE